MHLLLKGFAKGTLQASQNIAKDQGLKHSKVHLPGHFEETSLLYALQTALVDTVQYYLAVRIFAESRVNGKIWKTFETYTTTSS